MNINNINPKFSNPKLYNLYDFMINLSYNTRNINNVDDSLIATIKHFIDYNITIIARNSDKVEKLRKEYAVDSISINNSKALIGNNNPVIVESDAVMSILTDLFNEILGLQEVNDSLNNDIKIKEKFIKDENARLIYLNEKNIKLEKELEIIKKYLNIGDTNINININTYKK